ncbi:MAG TPA: hypothetical protein DCP92_24400, partial [Nitrospiraceae bacterium]|nr:hypothetical protein [Nitrospiraceae bacterium]
MKYAIFFIRKKMEKDMKKCFDCAYCLDYDHSGYNCGYLIKLIKKDDRCCKYFHAVGATEKADKGASCESISETSF